MPRKFRATLNKPPPARWPLSQSRRDGTVVIVAQRMAGLLGALPQRHVVIPEPEASCVAVAAEAEGFDAASAYAAGKSLDTDEERSHVFWRYVHEVWCSAYRYNRSLPDPKPTCLLVSRFLSLPPSSLSSLQQLQLGLPSAFAPPPPAAPEE